MVVDFDDFGVNNHRLDLLHELRQANPAFRCTLFAIPTECPADFLETVPDWCEVAVHGWKHGDPPTDGGECKDWSYERMESLITAIWEHYPRFVSGFKAPGWQISDGCLQALRDHNWWVADQPYNDQRRPAGLRVHSLGDGDHWHGHIQNVCGNGIEETFDELRARVAAATFFQTVGEVVA